MLSFRLIYRYLIAVYHTIKRAYSKDRSKYDVEMEKKSSEKRCDNKLHVLPTDPNLANAKAKEAEEKVVNTDEIVNVRG